MKNVLSLGAGVQSTAVLLMSLKGELPKLDCAVFADTGWEPSTVYEHLERLKSICGDRIPIHRVEQGDLRADALVSQVRGKAEDGKRWTSLPLFTKDRESGSHGMIRRQCTYEYKIRPIKKFIRYHVLGLKPRQRLQHNGEKLVRQWFGISVDEHQRQRSPDEPWMENFYPLVRKRITRRACLEWVEKHFGFTPPRSACIGCPFHSDREWREMKLNRPEDFEDACQFDGAIRNCGGMRGQVFLHAKRIPLREIDFSNDVDRGQLVLWDDECSGMCGV